MASKLIRWFLSAWLVYLVGWSDHWRGALTLVLALLVIGMELNSEVHKRIINLIARKLGS